MGLCFDHNLDFSVAGLPHQRHFRVMAYTAYSPGGWTAPEQNGVAIVDLDAGQVIVDGLLCQGSGGIDERLYRATLARFQEWRRMTPAQFEAEITAETNCRFKGGFMEGLKVTSATRPVWVPKGMKVKEPSLTAVLRTLRKTVPLGYNADGKALFLEHAELFWRKMAKHNNWPTSETRVSANPAGIACSGEVYCEHKRFYAYLSESAMRPGITLLFRETREGANQYAQIPGSRAEFAKLCVEFGAIAKS